MFSSFGITDFYAYLFGTIAIILLPGPNSMYCMYVAGSQGIKQGYKTVSAIVIGDTILMLAAVLGAATLLKTSATMFLIFKALGGLYLAYIGMNLLISAYKGFKSPHYDGEHPVENEHLNPIDDSLSQEERGLESTINQENKPQKVFAKALTLSLSNPKAILFFLSFFIQFVNPHYENPAISFAILGVTLQIVSITYLSVLIFAGSGLAGFLKKRATLAATGNGAIGLLFVGFAVSLWRAKV